MDKNLSINETSFFSEMQFESGRQADGLITKTSSQFMATGHLADISFIPPEAA
jgi:hypothetical protein